MSRSRLFTALSLILLISSQFFSGSESARAQTRTSPQQQSVIRSSPQPAPPRNRSTPIPKALVAPPPTSVTPEVKDCPEACKTVTLVCGTPPSPPPNAPTKFAPFQDKSQGLIADSGASCGERMFVRREGDGACTLCVGTGPFSDLLKDPADNKCGKTISVEEFNKKYKKFREGLLTLDLSLVLGNLTGAELFHTVLDMYGLLQQLCGLTDELSHLNNKHSCYHHYTCDEADSTKDDLGCYTDPSVLSFVEKLLAFLDKTNLFPGIERQVAALKKNIIDAHCGAIAQMEVSEPIERCLCCSTTDGTPGVTIADCADCASKFCPQAVAPTSFGASNGSSPSFCAGFDVTGKKRETCDEFLTGEGPHTCDWFTKVPPVQKLAPNPTTMMSNPATSPTGRITCSIAPPPVPTCVSGSGGGAENICLTAPPLR